MNLRPLRPPRLRISAPPRGRIHLPPAHFSAPLSTLSRFNGIDRRKSPTTPTAGHYISVCFSIAFTNNIPSIASRSLKSQLPLIRTISTTRNLFQQDLSASSSSQSVTPTPPSLEETLATNPSYIPTEDEVLKALSDLLEHAMHTAPDDPVGGLSQDPRPTPGMFDPVRYNQLPAPTNPAAVDAAYNIIKAPGTFLSPNVLRAYTALVLKLNQPESLPEIFALYACKPILKKNGKLKAVNPKSIRNMIPTDIRASALDAAIAKGDMHLCLDIIHESYAAEATRRNRILMRFSPFGLLGAMLPPLGWHLANIFANAQEVTEVEEAKTFAFFAIMGYFFCTGSLGLISLFVWNDQMVRITWQKGTGLFWRWSREEERAALDKVALAFGFKEEWKWGVETGEDWELLREWCGRKEMVLDNPELMEGMN